MPPNPDLHRTNINLFHSDVDFLRRRHGTGWTVAIQEIIHSHVLTKSRAAYLCLHCAGIGKLYELRTHVFITCPQCSGTGYKDPA